MVSPPGFLKTHCCHGARTISPMGYLNAHCHLGAWTLCPPGSLRACCCLGDRMIGPLGFFKGTLLSWGLDAWSAWIFQWHIIVPVHRRSMLYGRFTDTPWAGILRHIIISVHGRLVCQEFHRHMFVSGHGCAVQREFLNAHCHFSLPGFLMVHCHLGMEMLHKVQDDSILSAIQEK